MTYPKPLSEKSLKKLYEEAGINEEKASFLHHFFLSAANLYGFVLVKSLWEIYKAFKEEAPVLKKRDFENFSAIARREKLPYEVYEISEVYSAEKDNPSRRLIIRKPLVGAGYGKFDRVYCMQESQSRRSLYIPDSLQNFLAFGVEYPLPTAERKELKDFLDNLTVTVDSTKLRNGKTVPCMHKGEKLKDFANVNQMDRYQYEYFKRSDDKNIDEMAPEELLEQFGPVSDKILRVFQNADTTFPERIKNHLQYVIDELNEVGAKMDYDKLQKLITLLCDYHNHSHLWGLNGWKPEDLSKENA